MKRFLQASPCLAHPYDDDPVLQEYIGLMFEDPTVVDDLRRMATLSIELAALSAADRLQEPVLTRWSPFGERIDRIELTATWKRAETIAAEEGVVAAAYENRLGSRARVYQFALVYLFAPSSDFYVCPLAMTDGAARTLIASGNEELIARAVPHLISRDPEQFWTSGQWMTELTGGSDVGRSITVATRTDEGWTLEGRKWFTSAATSQMALTLARPEGNDDGGHGLALFYLECDPQRGSTILLHRLKDKLGTRKLPTAELDLEGATATLVGGTTGGVRAIVPMLSITRTWNTMSAASLMRRGLSLARDYATKREAFGATLDNKPLHVDTLAGLVAEADGAFHLAFRLAELLGIEERTPSAESSALLRALTPIAKLTTARQAVAVLPEVIELFGGAGYVEDTGLAAMVRDAQVLSIWEGTTNVLALDLLRALSRGDAFRQLRREIQRLVLDVDEALRPAAEQVTDVFLRAERWFSDQGTNRASLEAGARRFALTLGRTLELALLISHATQLGKTRQPTGRATDAALRFFAHGIDRLQHAPLDASANRRLAGFS